MKMNNKNSIILSPKLKMLILLIVCAFCIIAIIIICFEEDIFQRYSHPQATPPKKHIDIPQDASWAGGIDGGYWFDCRKTKEFHYQYYCTIYNEYSGDIVTKGRFIIFNEKIILEEQELFIRNLKYEYYDGIRIHVQRDLTLVPDGWIEFPEAMIKIKYKKGKEVSEKLPIVT